MPHIAGRGRYAGETYPERAPAGSQGASCLLQVGYDQPPSTIIAPTQVGNAPMPRTDPATTPLAVEFAEVTRGNVVEVFWAATVGNPGGDGNVSELQFTGSVAVSFVPAPTFPDDFFLVANSQAATRIPAPVGPNQADSTYYSMSACAAFTVPAGVGDTVPLTVWMLYTASQGAVVGGTNLAGFVPGVGITLKATEYDGDCVPQPGPYTLNPLGE